MVYTGRLGLIRRIPFVQIALYIQSSYSFCFVLDRYSLQGPNSSFCSEAFLTSLLKTQGYRFVRRCPGVAKSP